MIEHKCKEMPDRISVEYDVRTTDHRPWDVWQDRQDLMLPNIIYCPYCGVKVQQAKNVLRQSRNTIRKVEEAHRKAADSKLVFKDGFWDSLMAAQQEPDELMKLLKRKGADRVAAKIIAELRSNDAMYGCIPTDPHHKE